MAYCLDISGQVRSGNNRLWNAYCRWKTTIMLLGNHRRQAKRSGALAHGVYAQWHNCMHSQIGQVIQRFFKAIMVQREAHLLELARYVVLHLVRAGICDLLEEWPLSS
jgi:putative transposase